MSTETNELEIEVELKALLPTGEYYATHYGKEIKVDPFITCCWSFKNDKDRPLGKYKSYGNWFKHGDKRMDIPCFLADTMEKIDEPAVDYTIKFKASTAIVKKRGLAGNSLEGEVDISISGPFDETNYDNQELIKECISCVQNNLKVKGTIISLKIVGITKR